MKEMQPEMAEKFSKAAFLKGLKEVLDADTTQLAYYQGLQMGLQLVNPIIGINQEAGVPLSKDLVYEAFKKVYEQDSVGYELVLRRVPECNACALGTCRAAP